MKVDDLITNYCFTLFQDLTQDVHYGYIREVKKGVLTGDQHP